MRPRNHLSTEALGLLADLIGGQVLRFSRVDTELWRRCEYAIGDEVVDTELAPTRSPSSKRNAGKPRPKMLCHLFLPARTSAAVDVKIRQLGLPLWSEQVAAPASAGLQVAA
jgi:hypothetical protein